MNTAAIPSLETRRLLWSVQDRARDLAPECTRAREGEHTAADVARLSEELDRLPRGLLAVAELARTERRPEGSAAEPIEPPKRTPKTIRFVMRIDAATADHLAELARAHRCTMSDAARQAIADAAAVAAAMRRA